jgi:hypothetical protein
VVTGSSTRPPLRREDIGQRPVVSPVVLVHTRFGLRHPQDLLRTYHDYRAVAKLADRSDDLLLSCFLFENPQTFHSLSFWSHERGIPRFGTVREHVEAARRVFPRLRYDPEQGPELWSTRWRLDSVSNNIRWPGLSLPTESIHVD